MLMSLEELVQKHDMKISGVLHLGAHLAEEAPIYDALGVGEVWWVEANPKTIFPIGMALAPYPNQSVVEALIYSEDDVKLPFNVTNYDGMSSSIFQFGTHPQFSPDTVFVETVMLWTVTVDTLAEDINFQANFLNMDLQGAELHALRGAEDTLFDIDYVMTEVNCEEVYKGCARIEELDELLGRWKFERVETYWVPNQGWGDALYIKRGRQ